MGARSTAANPLLRWRPWRGASLYNVQIFRVRGERLTKVLSAFPRRTAFRVPAGRLRAGGWYVWRVWPYMGATRRYSGRPLGVSYFRVSTAEAR